MARVLKSDSAPWRFTIDEMSEARAIVGEVMPPTPSLCWPLLAERAGTGVWVKHENHTPIGAFKVRGGLVYLRALAEAGELPAGFVTATRGNHGQSIPFAAARYGVPVTVVVPEGNATEKNRAMGAWGARLIVHGRDFDEAREHAQTLAAAQGLTFVPSFHRELVRGVATYAMELFSAVPDLRAVYAPIGLGSGICGLVAARDLLGLETRIVGVVASSADAYRRSFEAGRVVTTPSARTFADGMACRVPVEAALQTIRGGVERIVSVDDDEIAEAMRILFSDTHNVAEGAGAAALAALLQDQRESAPFGRDEQVAVVLTGGNVDASVFAAVLNGLTPGV